MSPVLDWWQSLLKSSLGSLEIKPMKNPWKSICIGALFALLAQKAMAVGKIDDEAGWGFKLYLNFGYGSSQSQFSTDSENAITPNLESSGEKINDTRLFPLGRLDYTLSNLKTQFFLGQSGENIVRGQSQLEVGVSHMLGEQESLEVAYFPELLGSSKTWEDPYVTGKGREKTDQTVQGFRVRWQDALDTPFTLRYGYASSDIDDELSGRFLGLSQSQRSKMDRNGDYHRLTGEYLIFANDTTEVTPILSYTRGDTDGRAVGYDGIRIGLETRHVIKKRHSMSIFLDYEHRKYLESNPVFNEQQKDNEFGITATYRYLAPFGWEHARIIALAKYDRSTSNISFYEIKDAGVSIGFGWEY